MFIQLDYLRILRVLKEIKARKHCMEEYGAAYTAEGLITLAGSRFYTSAADTAEVIDDALTRFDRVLANADVAAEGGKT
jgi:glutamate-1-semialdehyde 2,1-aminomutase